MIKAVLLDLDNTLIQNPDVAFARGFLSRLEAYFYDVLGLGGASDAFRQALKVLAHGVPNAIRLNRDVILDVLCQSMEGERDSIENTLEAFYRDVYPTLAHHVKPVVGAVDLIRSVYDAGYAVVIATNPIYSHEATLARMAWAGLPIDDGLYALVTSADNMHFSKARASYYAEVVARVGVEPDEAVMVGDSIDNDILSSKKAGLYAYHISEAGGHEASDAGGRLSDFLGFMRGRLWEHDFAPIRLEPHHIVSEYLGNLGALYGLLQNVKATYWHQRPQRDEWSIVQILCHLLASERSHERPRLERILREDNPFIVAPAPPGPDLAVCGDDGWMVARQFELERRTTMAFIEGLNEDDWHRKARHSVFGNTDLLEMAHFTAQHDRLHLNQLCQTIGYCE